VTDYSKYVNSINDVIILFIYLYFVYDVIMNKQYSIVKCATAMVHT